MTLTHSIAQAAAMIPCNERWLADGLRGGRFPGHKIGGEWRLTDGDLDAIIDACRVQGSSPVNGSAARTPRSRAYRAKS